MGSGTTLKGASAYNSYGEFFSDFRAIAAEYADLPANSVYNAWARAALANNPYVQNPRVKGVSSLPRDYGKDEIAAMIVSPDSNEQPLRQTAHALEWSAYPYRKIRTTYQALNTYRYFSYPAYLTETDAESREYEREAVFVDKLNSMLRPDQWAHQITGQVMQEGKVAYIPRFEADKSHNQVKYGFLQQVPSDWWKIIGFNSESKYTVSFNMMYFLQPGTDWRQFGKLLEPYVEDFASVLEPVKRGKQGRAVYAGKNSIRSKDGRTYRVNLERFRQIRETAEGEPELYSQNGRWAYWVTLPVDKCWVFEIDDTNRTAVPPFTGLFLAMDQLSAYERVQMEIVQNPLISVALGEIPYMDKKEQQTEDQYELSPAGREMFLSYWYEMLGMANTSGIGAYFAPVKNLHLETLSEAPNATDITAKAYAYTMEKSGMSGLIPVTEEPRAGSVTISAQLEERFCFPVYRQMENMMNSIYSSLKLRFDWRFVMFGGFLSDEKTLKSAKEGIEKGILSDTYVYLALKGRSVMSDLAMSRAIKASGILELREPLAGTAQGRTSSASTGKVGRPTKGMEDISSTEGVGDGQEDDLDNAFDGGAADAD